MGLFSKDIQSMDDLFVHQLKDIYYAEKRILRSLPKMIEKATAPELRQGFEMHLRETEGHVARLEEVFRLHGTQPDAVTCRRSTASSRRPTRLPARSPTRRCWTPRSPRPRRPSSTTRSRATAR